MGRNLQKDTAAAKNVAAFIAEVAARVPKVVLPATASLLALLDGEVPSLHDDELQGKKEGERERRGVWGLA